MWVWEGAREGNYEMKCKYTHAVLNYFLVFALRQIKWKELNNETDECDFCAHRKSLNKREAMRQNRKPQGVKVWLRWDDDELSDSVQSVNSFQFKSNWIHVAEVELQFIILSRNQQRMISITFELRLSALRSLCQGINQMSRQRLKGISTKRITNW